MKVKKRRRNSAEIFRSWISIQKRTTSKGVLQRVEDLIWGRIQGWRAACRTCRRRSWCPWRGGTGWPSSTSGTRRGATRRTSRGRTTSPAAASRRGCRSSCGPPAARTPSSSTARSARCEVRPVLGCFRIIYPSPRKIQG